MSTASDILAGPIAEARILLPTLKFTAAVNVLLLAIGLQESNLTERVQRGNGPARGLWQFERGGGVKGVMTHAASKDMAYQVAIARGVPWDAAALWAALATDDVLAACFARLLLWTDPKPVPAVGNVDGAYGTYVWNWRPGRPHAQDWPANYDKARAAVGV